MSTIYAVDAHGYWTGGARQIAADEGCPPGWVRASAPNPPSEKVASINGTGWRYVADTDTLAADKAAKLADLAGIRWQRTQVFDYDGETDVPADSAMSAVIGTIVGAQILNPEEPFIWKLKPGVFRSWYVSDVQTYGLAIREHIQACFGREAVLATMIDSAASVAALNAIDLLAGWP